jgi:chromosome segregation ATPase
MVDTAQWLSIVGILFAGGAAVNALIWHLHQLRTTILSNRIKVLEAERDSLKGSFKTAQDDLKLAKAEHANCELAMKALREEFMKERDDLRFQLQQTQNSVQDLRHELSEERQRVASLQDTFNKRETRGGQR